MPDGIQPALTPEEWRARCVRLEENLGRETAVALVESHLLLRSHDTWRGEPYTAAVLATPHTVVSIMALANHALPDDDPRKITNAWIEELRKAAHLAQIEARGLERCNLRESAEKSAAALDHMADVLASLLPPTR